MRWLFQLLLSFSGPCWTRRERSQKVGKEAEANRKQTESKPEARGNWKLGETVSEKEREKEVEVEVENEYYNKHSPSPSETTNVSGELPNSPPAAAVLPHPVCNTGQAFLWRVQADVIEPDGITPLSGLCRRLGRPIA